MPIETNLEDQLNKFREQYYQENKKNTFFKTSQKNDCAEKVVQHFSIEQTSIGLSLPYVTILNLASEIPWLTR